MGVLSNSSLATVEAVNIKRRKEIKPSSQGKVSGKKWNLLRLISCLDFFVLALLSKMGRIKLDAGWADVNCISVMM